MDNAKHLLDELKALVRTIKKELLDCVDIKIILEKIINKYK
jgi:hypothetical protein